MYSSTARAAAALFLSLVVLAGLAPAASAAPSEQSTRYLVRFVPGTDVATEARSLKTRGHRVGRTFSHAVRAVVVDATPAQALSLRRSARVAAVEVDGPVYATATQESAPWGLDRIDQRSLPLSTTYTPASAGAGVSTYVVDTGVLAGHADFGDRVTAGWTAISDGRGSTDCNGHGTHVAGTVAGTTYGVAKSATIVPVRVLGCDGSGRMSDVVAGLDWVAANHSAGTPAVVNLSLGGGANSTLDTALQNVIADGVTAVVAAGNSGADACTSSPARVPAAVTVAASDAADRQASFSNFGTCVDLYAPGVSIVSAWYTSTTATASLSGTSMAAPHAAGAAAALLSLNPSLTPAQVEATLNGDATTGVVTSATAGTPNRLLYSSAATEPVPAPAVTAPAAATNVAAVAGRKSATVSWTKGSDGGSPLTGQTVVVYSGSTRVGSVGVSASATSARITGLRAGKSYAFTVIATNSVGSSPESARSNTITALR